MAEKELDEALAELDETRKTAERELSALRGHQERLGELERDKDAILDSYAGMAPEALESLAPEERHRVYRMLRIRAVAHVDSTLEVSGGSRAQSELLTWERHPHGRFQPHPRRGVGKPLHAAARVMTAVAIPMRTPASTSKG